LGLRAIAEAEPGRTAIFDPNGPAVSYAELAARSDQYGRGLQSLGLRPGDTVAGLLPNGTDALALFFAAAQTGLYVVPVNWHLTALEVAYILADGGARVFMAHERFAGVAADAADAAGIDPGSRFALGQVPGFAPLAGSAPIVPAAREIWLAIEKHQVNVLVIIGDAMARPLVEAYAAGDYDASSLGAVSSSAALFSPGVKDACAKALPDTVITEAIGSTETGFAGLSFVSAGWPAAGMGRSATTRTRPAAPRCSPRWTGSATPSPGTWPGSRTTGR
jgi:acyl-CoA synthetase (AMP-forming)/AMP-acid ligase II